MFDSETADFIRSAPSLPGLPAESLVDELTTAYVEIAAARVALAGNPGTPSPELMDIAGRMARLADTFEAQVILNVNPERLRSTAFVAASARQALAQIHGLWSQDDAPTILNEDVIGAELAASLLFLIAQRSSDAFEASRQIRAAGEPSRIRRALILAVLRYARGRFDEVLEMVDHEDLAANADPTTFATDLLFRQILVGLRMLAEAGLGFRGAEAIEQAMATFAEVRARAVEEELREADDYFGTLRTTSVFAGPHHLAALLERAGRSLFEDALVFTPPPAGVDVNRWTEWLVSEAQRWPFLWENHRRAIQTGYLEPGASFVMTTPTGSGKTTLAALKIAATLAAGRKVLYLAPTHALVGQVENDLNERVISLAKAESIDQVNIVETVEQLPDIAVVTPERCFALLTFAPNLFQNVGLLVFDEFHLLGATPLLNGTEVKIDRRSIDAMLCLLTFQAVQPGADFLLLSAMVSNGNEVAAWLRKLTGRNAIAFTDPWKPTRQLKSCVVYERERLQKLRESLKSAATTKVAAALGGLFSLSSGWNPNAVDRLLVRPFSHEPVKLGIGERKGRRYLTSNRNEVAAFIADKFAASGLKVIVFCESIVFCGSVAKSLNKGANAIEPQLDERQTAWRETAIAEVGSVDAIYDAGFARASVHHGELLPEERRLVETIFRDRESGVRVLAATSTLAQGLNLPCDVVILASTDRLDDSDPEEKKRTALHPHEILNALGRAGRAGHAATGVAIVVPGEPIGCETDGMRFTSDDELKVVFSDGDQCLPIADPLGLILDQIEVDSKPGPQAEYLLRRLSMSLREEQREGVESFASLASRTFGFYQRKSADPDNADAWLNSRKTVLANVLATREDPPSLPWQEELAAKTGAPVSFINKLTAAYSTAPLDALDAGSWVDWLLKQFDPAAAETEIFLRPETTIRVFGRAITSQTTPEAANAVAIAGTIMAMRSWFGAGTLLEMEREIAQFIAGNEGNVARPTGPDKFAKRARRFAIRLAPDVSFLCGVLSQVAQKLSEQTGIPIRPMVTFLPQLTRQGFATPYHYLLSRTLETTARPTVAQAFNEYEPRLERSPEDGFDDVRRKLDIFGFDALFDELPDLGDGDLVA